MGLSRASWMTWRAYAKPMESFDRGEYDQVWRHFPGIRGMGMGHMPCTDVPNRQAVHWRTWEKYKGDRTARCSFFFSFFVLSLSPPTVGGLAGRQGVVGTCCSPNPLSPEVVLEWWNRCSTIPSFFRRSQKVDERSQRSDVAVFVSRQWRTL